MTKNEYCSPFAKELKDYLELRCGLGMRMNRRVEARYGALDKFFIDEGLTGKEITKSIIDAWCRQRTTEKPSNTNARISLMRGFCQYLADLGYKVHVPARKNSKRTLKYEPYIFSDEELHCFFKALDRPRFSNRATLLRDTSMPIFFRILYTSGMRASELATMKIGDVDLDKAVMTVRMGKNRTDRLVPFHPSLVVGCRKIISILPSPSSTKDYLFQNPHRGALSTDSVYRHFRKVLAQTGISHCGRGKGPRVHDFRHTYCVNLLRKWIEEKRDLMAWLPYMRIMLGHAGFRETAYYLRLTRRMFPSINRKLDEKFPNIIEKANYDEPEYY